jgi:hypothetical protein
MSKLLQERWARLAGIFSNEPLQEAPAVKTQPSRQMRSRPSVYQANTDTTPMSTSGYFGSKKTKSDSKQNMSGDITRTAGAKTQEMIVAFFEQMKQVSASSNETSEHTADVVVKVTFNDEDGNENELDRITARLNTPEGITSTTFGIEAKKGSGDFDGDKIQTNQSLFEEKINENAGFVIEHKANESFLFCLLDNEKGRDLQTIMEHLGQGGYAMVNATELWNGAVNANRGEGRLVKQVTYEQLASIISSKNPKQSTLQFTGNKDRLTAKMKVRVMEKELKRPYQASRRDILVQNLVKMGVTNLTPQIFEDMQRKYNEYGIPLFCAQINKTAHSGYSGLPEILPIHEIRQIDILDGIAERLYHPDVLEILGDEIYFEHKGGTFIHIPDPGMAGTISQKDLEEQLDRKAPPSGKVNKLSRGLQRMNKMYDVLLKQGLLNNIIDLNNLGRKGQQDRYVHVDDWENAFGDGKYNLPERLEIESIGIPQSSEHFAPTEQQTKSAIDLLNLMIPSDVNTLVKVKPTFYTDSSGAPADWVTDLEFNEDALASDPSFIDRNTDELVSDGSSPLDTAVSNQSMQNMRDKLARSIAVELDHLHKGVQDDSDSLNPQPKANEWDALKLILQDAGVKDKDIKGLMIDLAKDESISIELKKAFNHWQKSKDGKENLKSFDITESIWKKIETFLLVEKYSISSKLL